MPPSAIETPERVSAFSFLQRFIPLIVCLSSLLPYLGTFRFAFVYDDFQQVINNPLILSWHNLPWMFKTDVWRFSNPLLVSNYWRPLFMVWLLLNRSLFGLNPAGWHIAAVLLHTAATYACFRLVLRLGGDLMIAATAALIFAVHPVHIETVAWISGATDSLMALFFLLSLLAFLNGWEAQSNKRWIWYGLSAVSFGMCVLSKETGLVLPAVVLAYILLFRSKRHRSWTSLAEAAAVPLLLFSAVALLYWIGRRYALSGVMHSRLQISVIELLMTWPSLLFFYLKHLLWPVGLGVFYGTTIVLHPSWTRLWFPLIGIVVLGAALTAIVIRKRDPLLSFACLIFLLPLAPAFIFLLLYPTDYAHDRYLYLPCLGFAIIVAKALRRFSPDVNRSTWFAVIALTLALSVATSAQVIYWANDLLLFDRATRTAPGYLPAFVSLGDALAARGRMPEARRVFEQVLKADPNNSSALFSLGLSSFLDGNNIDCERYLSRAVELKNLESDTSAVLAECRIRLGKFVEAEQDIRRALMLKPYKPGYGRVLAETLAGQGRLSEASTTAEAELKRHPEDIETRNLVERLHASKNVSIPQK
jgi:protein O-mannosyl-transferase